MNELLKPGQQVRLNVSDHACEVKEFLGGGGQGEVYRAESNGDSFALKWYFPHTATPEQRKSLEKLVHESPPSDAFLWPMDLVSREGANDFGYLMKLRPSRFKGLTDLVTGRIDPTFRTLVTAGLNLTDGFFRLHAKGLCYRDISFGNAFFDPKTGEVLICDNDNVTENRSPIASVLGTPDFMAPEIVRQESMPSRQTDYYSLAVLLFYIFHIQHPLIGKRILSIRAWDLPARKKLLGDEPLFIFDPKDTSNEAIGESQDPLKEAGANALVYWPIYPKCLQDVFIKSFTEGLKDPEHGRVSPGAWRRVLSKIRDSIFYCNNCSSENFYDPETVRASGGKPSPCWKCKKEPQFPFRIRIGKSIIMLTHDAKLYPHHLEQNEDYDFIEDVAGEVIAHPTDPNIWGLKNCTDSKWVATPAGGDAIDVPPGRSAKLANKTRINFGKEEGEIRYQ